MLPLDFIVVIDGCEKFISYDYVNHMPSKSKTLLQLDMVLKHITLNTL